MVKSIDGFYIWAYSSNYSFVEYTTEPFSPYTDVYANISISELDSNVPSEFANPRSLDFGKFSALAFILWTTTYLPDGSESEKTLYANQWTRNAVGVQNCSRIHFVLAVFQTSAVAQINIFRF